MRLWSSTTSSEQNAEKINSKKVVHFIGYTLVFMKTQTDWQFLRWG